MKLYLKIWRQSSTDSKGRIEDHEVDGVSPDISFLEMLDLLNDRLESNGIEPVAFEHDCREGICGSCSMMINGEAHGPRDRTTACQLHMREFKDGDTIIVEPWRAAAFPILKDLIVDRTALDRIIQAGGYISVSTGGVPDGNAIPIPKDAAEQAMDAAECIGCGACVAACPNGSAMLFTSAKVSHMGILPQGKPEQNTRVQAMVKAMDDALFGSCTNFGECQDACPKGISINFIKVLNKDFLRASLTKDSHARGKVDPQ